MNRLLLIFLFTISELLSFAQNIQRTYWGLSSTVHEEFQVNNNGVKHGFYKEYSKKGEIYESGFYTNGQKSGTWTTYDVVLHGTGQIASTMQFSDGKMNGIYKQWCWEKGKRYLCGDYVYENDIEVLGKQFFSNGKIKFDRNRKMGLYNEWFEDGSKKTETINGKHYTFEWVNSRRVVSDLKFDSAGTFYEFDFTGPSNKLRSAILHFSKESINIDFNNIEKPTVKIMGIDKTMNWYYVEETPLDSALFRLVYSTYLNSPDPNHNKSNTIEFDFKTGTVKHTNKDKQFRTFCYHNTTPATHTVVHHDANGKPIVLEVFNDEYSKKNMGRSAVVKRFTDGKIFDEKNSMEKYTIKYHDNGEVKSQLFEADQELNRPQTIYQEFFENGDSKIESVKDHYGNVISFFEYYENGIIKSERVKDKNDKNILLDYNTEGNLIRIIYLSLGGNDTEIIDIKSINAFQFDALLEKFNKKYLITKTVQNGNYINHTYEYPKGENLYRRAKKVIDKYNIEIQYSTDQANSTKLINEYKVFIEKLLEIASTETLDLNLALKKIKNTDEIKEAITNWKPN